MTYEIIEHTPNKTIIDLDDGKYRLIYDISNNPRIFKCLRYGEEWRDVMGDNLIYWLMCSLTENYERESK